MKKLIWIIVVLVIIWIGWSMVGKSEPKPVGEEVRPIKIGAILPLTGPIKIGQMSGLTGIGADIGEEERNGALLAAEEINTQGGVKGHPIQLISEDSPAIDLKAGAGVAKKLISIDNVLAIVGPQWDGQAEVVATIAADQKVPTISQNASTDIESKINSPYFFTTWPDNEVGIRELLKFAKAKGWQKIAIIEPANFSFWLYTANLFEKNAPEFGIEIVARELGTDFNVVDYRTMITKAKAKKPDAFFGSYADLECVFLKQTAELGIPAPLLSTESAGTPKALEDCAPLMEGRLHFSTPSQSHGYDTFVKSYETRFKQKPLSPSAVTAYNAVLVLVEVIGELIESDKEVTRENIKIGLDSVKFEGGVSIPVIEFNDKGFIITPDDAFEMQTVQGGKFVKAE